MTVEELISTYEDLEDLDAVYITRNKRGHIYEAEDVEFIEYELLELQAIAHKFEVKEYRGKKIRCLYINC